MNCIFCRIANHEVPAETVYETDTVLAFRDIHPKAPTHVLVIPKVHHTHVAALGPEDNELKIALHDAISQIIRDLKLDESGCRVVANLGANGGQEVAHLHYHILGGRRLNWPPG
ncbi:MAG: histidine triad nucleotide-binding protein [Candidatus Margulisiibacteriota bacterium]